MLPHRLQVARAVVLYGPVGVARRSAVFGLAQSHEFGATAMVWLPT
ncbi:hypothetical protein ACFOY2_43605 [Nonomuraea purpurea]|uniref:ATP-binding protein n=1 Tax=Nonomuraea purpurea TaxID=1849276 RepID=A0ABV8GJP9_9ACTN